MKIMTIYFFHHLAHLLKKGLQNNGPQF